MPNYSRLIEQRLPRPTKSPNRHTATNHSVTRFGEISPLGDTFQNLRQTFEGLFFVWQNFEPTFGHILYILGKFELLQVAK